MIANRLAPIVTLVLVVLLSTIHHGESNFSRPLSITIDLISIFVYSETIVDDQSIERIEFRIYEATFVQLLRNYSNI